MTSADSPYFAAIDLGSNSFHMIIARTNEGSVETVDRVKEMVQIARGLDAAKGLAEDAQERALACLSRFAERIRDIPPSQVRAVGTKSLRSAPNAQGFLKKAESTLGHPIAIISGYEEARLVYSGLAHCVANDNNRRLVIDIGGASTEFIIGTDENPSLLESLSLGCVAHTDAFGLREPNERAMRRAYLAASQELEQIRTLYRRAGWSIVYGTSGTMRAIAQVLTPANGGAIIQRAALKELYEAICKEGIKCLKGVPTLRAEVLSGGIAILLAIFDELEIDQIYVADATLKEGLLFDTIGRLNNIDARFSAVEKLQKQFRVDIEQAQRVADCAVRFWKQIEGPVIPTVSRTKILNWAAKLHEVGLGISHSSHHHHSHYILLNSDLAGFGRYEQRILADLVRAHRKKLKAERFDTLSDEARAGIYPIVMCLRLAVILNRRRENLENPPVMHGKDTTFGLVFPRGWLDANPLTTASLESEVANLQNVGITLMIGEDAN